MNLILNNVFTFGILILIPFLINKLNKYIKNGIENIIKNNYIYNLSWEDPKIDIDIYGHFKDKNICMITTGGDNALDYLIEEPNSINTFDLNCHQNYLLEMKIACIKSLEHNECFEVIGNNNYKIFLENWHIIKQNMSPESQIWWSNNKTIMKNFIYSGSVKYAYYFLNIMLIIFGIKNIFYEISQNPGIENQKILYHKYEKKILMCQKISNIFEPFLIKFIGVPEEQYNLYKNKNFSNELFKYLLYHTDLYNDNYFYHGYFYGKFTKECCPRYLKNEYYDIVKNNLNKINIHTKKLCDIEACNSPKEKFDIIILLDHLDWLDNSSIRYELSQLQQYSKKSCKYCWRSFSEKQHLYFLNNQEFIHSSILNRNNPNKYCDRVGSYNSIHVAKLSKPIINIIKPNYPIYLNKDLQTIYHMYFKSKNKNDFLNDFYENQTDNYDSYRLRMLHGKPEIMELLPLSYDSNILLLAGGTGDLLDYFNYNDLKKIKNIDNIDYCKHLLNFCKHKFNNFKNINCILENILEMKHEKKYDLIIITYSLTMINKWDEIIDKCIRALKDNGFIAICDFTIVNNNFYNRLIKYCFSLDQVYLESTHMNLLNNKLNCLYQKINYGSFPFIPIYKCGYFCGLYKKKI